MTIDADKIRAWIGDVASEVTTQQDLERKQEIVGRPAAQDMLERSEKHARELLQGLAVVKASSNNTLDFKPIQVKGRDVKYPCVMINVLGIGDRFIPKQEHFKNLKPYFAVMPDGEINFVGTNDALSTMKSVEDALQTLIRLAGEKNLFPRTMAASLNK